LDSIERTAYDPDDPHDARGGFAEADIRAQLERLQDSRTFARARRLQQLLSYLVEHSLSASDRDLHEAIIGIEHFRRGSDFDCQSDTIVRVSARRLRDRLGEYYREEGAADPIRFEIPKGRYRVLFHPGALSSAPASPPAPLPAAAAPPRPADVPEPGAVAAARATAAARPASRWSFSPGVAVLVLAAVMTGLVASLAPDSDQPRASSPEREPAAAATATSTAVQEQLTLARFYYGRRAAGDVALALDHFESALALDSEIADAWVGVAKCIRVLWLEEERFSSEVALLRQFAALRTALSIDPFHAEAHVREATLQRRWLRDPEAASRSMALALRYGGNDPEVLSMVAGYRGLQGDLEGAIDTLRSAVAREPTRALYRGNLGSYLLQAGRLEEAVEELRRALTLNPGQPETELELVETLLGLGDGPEARAVAAAMAPGPEAALAAALLGASDGQLSTAVAALENLAGSTAAPEVVLAVRGYLLLGDTEGAVNCLERNRELLLGPGAAGPRVALDLYDLLRSPAGRRARGHPGWEQWWQSAGLVAQVDGEPSLIDW